MFLINYHINISWMGEWVGVGVDECFGGCMSMYIYIYIYI